MKLSERGYTLVELLVAMMLSGVALSLVVKDFSHTVHQRKDMEQIAEAQQAVGAVLTFVTQELRQAGACLPTLGNFVALDGQDSGDQDSLTLRIGVTNQDSIVCVRTVSTAASMTGSSVIEIQDPAGFDVGQNIYVTRMGGQGNTFRVESVSGNLLTIEGSFDADYLVGSGVYAIEERTYAIDISSGEPILTIAVDGGDPEPLAKGIEVFNVRYRMDPCPPCTLIDQPADNAEWRTVREVEVTVAAETKNTLQTGEVHVVTETTSIKPRNLI